MTTEFEIVTLLRSMSRSKSYKKIAEELDVSPQFLSDVIMGRRGVSENLAKKLGYELKKYFEKMTTTDNTTALDVLKMAPPNDKEILEMSDYEANKYGGVANHMNSDALEALEAIKCELISAAKNEYPSQEYPDQQRRLKRDLSWIHENINTLRAALTRETVEFEEMPEPNDELGWTAGYNAAIKENKKHKGKIIG